MMSGSLGVLNIFNLRWVYWDIILSYVKEDLCMEKNDLIMWLG